jgi:hypothetical protein
MKLTLDPRPGRGDHENMPPCKTKKSLDAIERELQLEYKKRRRAINPGYTFSSAILDSTAWLAAARLVDKHDADPVEWIDAQFSAYPGAFPQVTQLSSSSSERFYLEKYTGAIGDDTRSEAANLDEKVMHLQFKRLTVRAAMGMDPESEVCDPNRDYTPLFRILYCPEKRVDEMKAKWGKAAKEAVRRSGGLRRYLKKLKLQNQNDRAKRVVFIGIPE